MALVGVRVRTLIRCHNVWPGTAPSRLKAKSIREFAAVDAMPQKNWATTAINSSNSAPTLDSAAVQMATGAAGSDAVAAYTLALVGITKVMPGSGSNRR